MIEISIYLRVLLVLGSISTAAFILKRIRQAKVQIEDCIFWLFFASASCAPRSRSRPTREPSAILL